MDPLPNIARGSHRAATSVQILGGDLFAEEPKEDQLVNKVEKFIRGGSKNITELLGTTPTDPNSRIMGPTARRALILGGGALIALGAVAALIGGGLIVAGAVTLLPWVVIVGSIAAGGLFAGTFGAFAGGGLLIIEGVFQELAARGIVDSPDVGNFATSLGYQRDLNRDAREDLVTLFKSGHVSGERQELYVVQLRHLSNLSPEQKERFLLRCLKTEEALKTVRIVSDPSVYQPFSGLVKEAEQAEKLRESLPESLQERFRRDLVYLDEQLPRLLRKNGVEKGCKGFDRLKNEFTSFWEEESRRAIKDMRFLEKIDQSQLQPTDKVEFKKRFLEAREDQLETLLGDNPYPWMTSSKIYHARTKQLMPSWHKALEHACTWANKKLSQNDLEEFPALLEAANEGRFKIANNPKFTYFRRLGAVSGALRNDMGVGDGEILPVINQNYLHRKEEGRSLTELEIVEIYKEEWRALNALEHKLGMAAGQLTRASLSRVLGDASASKG